MSDVTPIFQFIHTSYAALETESLSSFERHAQFYRDYDVRSPTNKLRN